MNPFDYRDGRDFLAKTGMTIDEALDFLDHEIQIRGNNYEQKKEQKSSGRRA